MEISTRNGKAKEESQVNGTLVRCTMVEKRWVANNNSPCGRHVARRIEEVEQLREHAGPLGYLMYWVESCCTVGSMQRMEMAAEGARGRDLPERSLCIPNACAHRRRQGTTGACVSKARRRWHRGATGLGLARQLADDLAKWLGLLSFFSSAVWLSFFLVKCGPNVFFVSKQIKLK